MNIRDIQFWSSCCGAEILCHDENGHGHCSDCGDTTTPDAELQEVRNQKKRNFFDLLFWAAIAISFFVLLASCHPYKELNGNSCESLYTLPVSSPFFTVTYHRGKREVYLLTDLRVANNRNHFITDLETCNRVYVSAIEQKAAQYKLTFQLTEEQFLCYERNLNESNITYCTRNVQRL